MEQPHLTPGTLAEVLPLKVSIVDRSSTGHTFVNDQQPGKGNVMKLSAGDVPQLHFLRQRSATDQKI